MIASNGWRPRRLLASAAVLITVAGPWLAPDRAEAQYGGFGFGFGIGRTVPPPIEFLNSKALLNASQATFGPRGFNAANPYGNSGNAYFNRVRDSGFTDRYAIDSRVDWEFRNGRRMSSRTDPSTGRATAPATAATPPAPAAAPAAPVVPIASFFSPEGVLVWPEMSPTEGEFQAKRDASDRASLNVLTEVKVTGMARIGTVTDARAKLIAYGQPALAWIREKTTPRISDTFHMFLLSLYESLGQAANPPRAVASAQPAR